MNKDRLHYNLSIVYKTNSNNEFDSYLGFEKNNVCVIMR